VLTPAGELLLSQVKPLLQAFSYVETRAATLRNGARTRLDLVVDSIFPANGCSPFCASFSSAIRRLR
jgi:DNA-binding transcriptional LysR family regulator